MATYTSITVPRGSLAGLITLVRQSLGAKPQLALVYGYQELALFLTAVLLRISGARVLSMNDSKFDDYRRNWWKDLLKVCLLTPYQGFLAASQRSADYLYYLRGDIPTIAYYCAIDTARIQTGARRTFEATAFADRDFVMVGRFTEKKNHHLMLDIFEQYAADNDSPRRLRLIGYGPMEKALRQRIASSTLLSRLVSIEGYRPADQIPHELGSCLALLLPSKEEQFGIVVTEALSAGVPVILSPQCGATELVASNVNGYVVDPYNTEGWLFAMTTLGTNETHWSRMSEQTLRYAQRADVSVFVQAVLALARPATAVRLHPGHH